MTHGDIDSNSGLPPSKKKISSYFLLCHWNANSILVHNEISLLTACNITYKWGIICVSEIYLGSSVDSVKISVPGYDIVRADHPNNQKWSGVCLYFKENMIVRRLDVSYIAQCLLCEITTENKKGYIVALYRSPSQITNEFHDFQYNFEKLLNQGKQFVHFLLLYLVILVPGQNYGGLRI